MADLAVGEEGDLDGGGMADGLGEEADHVLEVGRGPQAAVPPGGIAGAAAHGGAALALDDEAVVHRRADLVEAGDDDGVEVVVRWVAEGRGEHDGALRPGLVVIVDDLREPLAVDHPVHVLALGERGHVEVAVVVVAGVLVVQHRDALGGALERVVVAHVPVGHEGVAVRVGVRGEEDDVVEEAHRLGVVAADHLPHQFHELLDAEDLVRMEAAVDPDDGLALGGQRAGLFLADALGLGEPAGDLPVALEVGPVGGGGDGRHPLIAPFRGLADGLQRHAVRLLGEEVPVVGEALVVDELVVGAEAVAELLFRGGELGGGGVLGRGQRGEGEGGGGSRESACAEGGEACGHGFLGGLDCNCGGVRQR